METKNDVPHDAWVDFKSNAKKLMFLLLLAWYPCVLIYGDVLVDLITSNTWLFTNILYMVCGILSILSFILVVCFSLDNIQSKNLKFLSVFIYKFINILIPMTMVYSFYLILPIFDAAHKAFPWKMQFMLLAVFGGIAIQLVGVFCCTLVGKFVTTFVVSPVWWLLGKPDHPDMVHAIAAEKKVDVPNNATNSQVSTPPTQEVPPQRETKNQETHDPYSKDQTYDFDWKKPKLKLENLEGMTALKSELRTYMHPFASYKMGKGTISDRNGFLLSGPPGNGKTVFAEAIAGELGLRYVRVSCQDITSKFINESASVLKSLFKQAREVPSVIFFDEFDSVATSRTISNGHNEDRKVVTALLTELDKAREERVVVIAATNYVENLDSAIVRDGRFDFRIEIPFPDEAARIAILTGLVRKYALTVSVETIEYVASLWERRAVAFMDSTVKRLRDGGKGIKGKAATVDDFKHASREASRKPSAIPASGAKLSELALPADVRTEADSLVYRLRHWEEIAERGGEAPSGVLLYGPPGTGKTNLVRAIARELEYWHVFEVNATEVLQNPSKFRETVELAAKHRPAFVFIDEADELLRDRNYSNSVGATNEILKCMDGLMGKIPEIVFIAATNNTEVMDAAALRNGRFSEKIFMGNLTGEDLVLFLDKEFSSKKQVTFSWDLNPRSLAERLGTISPADAKGILRKAINYTFGQDDGARDVCMQDVEKAIQATML